MRKMRFLLAASVLCLGAALSAAAAGPAASVYTEKGLFTVSFPEGWVRAETGLGLSSEEKKVYGAELAGPESSGIAVRIGVHYYAPGNLLQPTAKGFIKLHSRPALGVDPDDGVYGNVKASKVGNYRAEVFDRTTYVYVPPDAMNPKKVPVYERFAVVPVRRGFYVLRYYAPKETAERYLPAFEAVLSSFRMLKR